MFVDELKFVTNSSAVEEGGKSGKCVCVCVCVLHKLTYCKTQMCFGQIQQNHLKGTLHHLPLRYQTVVSEGKEMGTCN